MPAIDIFLYWDRGLYGDFGLAIYYFVAGIYGFLAWQFWQRGKSDGQPVSVKPITHFPLTPRMITGWVGAFLVIWVVVWAFLNYWTNSTVPITDSLTNALSIMGMWMMARKYVEQWLVWIVADAIYVWLYAYKDLPFKATLYTFYIIVAFFGIRRWMQLMRNNK